MIISFNKAFSLVSITEPSIVIELSNGSGDLLIWGDVYLFKDKAFNSVNLHSLSGYSFDGLIPLFTGRYLAALIKDNTIIKLAADFYGHMGAYLQDNADTYIVTDDIRNIHFDKHIELDRFQIRHFVDKGYCWESGTFIKQLRKISPTVVYVFGVNGINQEFLPFPTFVREGTLQECMSRTLKSIVENNGNVGLFFSSGVDSSYIREIAFRNNIKLKSFQHLMKKPRYFATEEDLDLSLRLNFNRNDIEICGLEDADNFFKEEILTTVRLLPFDFHPALIQSHIYPIAKKEGVSMMISGQNSDSVYALAATHHIPLSKTITKLLSFHIHHSGLKGHYKRYLQTGHFLRKLVKNKPSCWTRYIWKKINPDYDFTFSNLLMAYLKDDAELPVICHNKEDKYEKCYIEEYQRFVSRLNILLEKGESPRMIMIRGKLLGHCQGRDVRCLTEWAKEYKMGNIQVFTSAPILSWLGSHDLGFSDIFIGKRELRKYLEKTIHYSKHKKLVSDYRNKDGIVASEPIRFHDMYNVLNTSGAMDALVKEACNLLVKEDIISQSEYNRYCESGYTNYSPRLAWLAKSISNLIE